MCKWLCLVEFSPVEQKHLKKQSLLRSPTAGVKWNQSYTRLETIKNNNHFTKKRAHTNQRLAGLPGCLPETNGQRRAAQAQTADKMLNLRTI